MSSRKKNTFPIQPTLLIPLIAIIILVVLALVNTYFSQWASHKKTEVSSQNYYGKPGGPTPPAKILSVNLGGAQGALGTKKLLTAEPFGKTTRGFYGKVASINGKQLTVEELIPNEDDGKIQKGKMYTVRGVQETIYVYQKENESDKKDVALFTPTSGSFADMRPGLFTYISSYENPQEKTNLTALEIIYSQRNPFVR